MSKHPISFQNLHKQAFNFYFNCFPDFDECKEGTHNCLDAKFEVCENKVGGFTCGCTQNYYLVDGECVSGK